jgi:succinate-semialdehyde dehydrogenase/glutarate-semialdehyde dehydrogenase
VDHAVAAGARVLAGGRSRPDLGPAFFEPTVLDGVTEEMSLCRNETFGPVVALYRVHSDEEAIRRANDTVYGLNASVVTRDLAAGQAVARRLRAGTVNVNEAYGAAWGSTRAPMGGMGDSGLGRRHGDEGLLKYTEAQTIATQRVLGMLTMSLAAMKKLGLK